MLLNGYSIMGADHQRIGQNNQDAYIYQQYENGDIFMAVSDGVGIQPYSEFGSRYQLLWLRQHFADLNYDYPVTDYEIQSSSQLLKREIRDLFNENDFETHFEATLVAAYLNDEYIYIFGCGDGYYQLNDSLVKLETGEDNTPQTFLHYKNYNIFAQIKRERVHKIILSTDGLRHWKDDKVYPMTGKPIIPFQQAVEERNFEQTMQMMNIYSIKRPQILRDDCTLVWYYENG